MSSPIAPTILKTDDSPEPGEQRDHFVKRHYRPRIPPDYFHETAAGQSGVVYQPDVYPFAAYLAKRFGCTHVVDVGCGHGDKLAALHPELQIVGIDLAPNVAECRDRYPFGTWIEWDLEAPGPVPIPEGVLDRAVIVCADVVEHLVDPTPLLDSLRSWLDRAPVCLVSTPERDLARGADDFGPPGNPAHVREWNAAEFEKLLHASGFNVAFLGLTTNNDQDCAKETILAVLEKPAVPAPRHAPSSFRAVAIVPTYNEQDIVVPSLRRLVEQGLDVYVVDYWSTDSTYDLAAQLVGRGLAGIERFPAEGPSPFYDWKAILRRVEALGASLEADWFLFQSADEVRRSPWARVDLIDALYRVERAGFDAVDFTVVEFHPVDDGYVPGTDFEAYFRHFEFGQHPAHFLEINAWKNLGVPVVLAESGGHEAAFEGRRVYPYKFLLRHYPIRSQAHGERKIFRDRKPRWSPGERAEGWHSHYDHVDAGHVFLRSPDELRDADRDFDRRYLVERLSGVGALRPERRGPPEERPAGPGGDERDRRIAELEAEVASREAHLQRIRASLGWRLLSRYRKLKYRYLLPLYHALSRR